MLEVDTFLTALYGMVDDSRQSRLRKGHRLGPEASFCGSGIMRLFGLLLCSTLDEMRRQILRAVPCRRVCK